MPVFSRPPLAKSMNLPSTRLMSAESTTHWLPYFWAAAGMMPGLAMAPELTLTLSAPHLSTRSKSSSVADAAAHRQRDEDLAGHLAQNVGEEGTSLHAGGVMS